MVNVAVVGGTGYGAVELIRLLNKHPHVHLKSIISHSQSGTEIKEVYPHLTNIINVQMNEWNIQGLSSDVDVVFFATPPGVSQKLVPECRKNNIACIDLSGDFRLTSQEVYETWYGTSAASEDYLQEATYGLTELYEQEIMNSKLISNPGCYPTATLLALLPIVKKGWVNVESIIIDGKSGVSGAGRKVGLGTLYSEINENLKAYKLGEHQHIPEIEQFIQKESGQETQVTFTTHLIPMTRGLMCTIYVDLNEEKTTEELINFYTDVYSQHPFVRVRQEGIYPATKEVSGSNYCDIGIHADARTGKVTIVSVIDNLVKGAAGQAIQNLNVMNGWDVTLGLKEIPMYP
ncbi:N-acetyl-gamma-glutamyl-phosphate reductase [Evansella cellulosilytica]|uniref:N-acetyl-gamma-glutamyl-phosphate reductase n=1 Tax=Evansella cellulosilytica (strain ATCC 21833 / DSM 2522 / FERM P-1141 / JCM 9156 / N-4) TaxID=649639 RepID=E6TYY9_EVAC2|nr:N-acetyl-gamma-glutamyl-phosphate reductase [Evansella cellulosilytica]ADU32432.1 N-acetyl-gamma-glutamyl-phosphate reductase [Evansella cellulosilytica DSM 2522]